MRKIAILAALSFSCASPAPCELYCHDVCHAVAKCMEVTDVASIDMCALGCRRALMGKRLAHPGKDIDGRCELLTKALPNQPCQVLIPTLFPQ